jgi:hypothetical protein
MPVLLPVKVLNPRKNPYKKQTPRKSLENITKNKSSIVQKLLAAKQGLAQEARTQRIQYSQANIDIQWALNDALYKVESEGCTGVQIHEIALAEQGLIFLQEGKESQVTAHNHLRLLINTDIFAP